MSSLSAKIREQIISSFRVELAEHLQTMNTGLLALEQGTVEGEERTSTLRNVFRAAHSLKGAARAVGITIIEQLAHALESVLDALQKDAMKTSSELFTACYNAVDAIQDVQQAYEGGETTPPIKATQSLVELQLFFSRNGEEKKEQDDNEHVESSSNGRKATSKERVKKTFEGMQKEKEDLDSLEETMSVPKSRRKTDDEPPEVIVERRKSRDDDLIRTRATDGETVRVKVNRLDTLMDHLNELLILKIRAQQRLEQIKNTRSIIVNLEKEWQSVRSSYAHRVHSQNNEQLHVSKDEKKVLRYTNLAQEQVHNTSRDLNIVERELASDISQMSLAIDELEVEVKSLRMLPLSTITAAFPRMVRDLAHENGKEIVMQITGAETELDKHILEQIKDPLIHLLRNAVDHGIESPAKRAAHNKPANGTITLAAEQIGKDVIIRISDDGQGLDMDAIRRRVFDRGIDGTTLSESELQRYIFEPGISTSDTVTDISGRGMGLDIVKKNLEELHGTCEVSSTPGQETTFTLTIPLRITGSRGLMVRTAGQVFAISINTVEYILSIRQKDIVMLDGHEAIYHNDQPVALLWLCDVLDLPRRVSLKIDNELPVIILRNGENHIAFIVDELAGEQEIVIKSLGDQLVKIAGLAGATILGTGKVVLILNANDLIAMAMRGGYTAAMKQPVAEAIQSSKPTHQVLVVDDSITTRTLEKNILEAAGYSVQLATDGQEALNLVGTGMQPDIIISDVSMPRVGGLELARRIKGNPQTSHVPIILVSSNDSAEDKLLGMDAGADAYITKGGFDQNNLLETIELIITPSHKG